MKRFTVNSWKCLTVALCIHSAAIVLYGLVHFISDIADWVHGL